MAQFNANDILARFEEEEDLDGPEDFEAKPLRYFDDMLRCSICRCLMNIPVILSGCDHNFCSECVRGHLRSKHSKNECPLRYCSKPFQERDIIPNKFLQKLIRKYREETRDAILGLEERCGGGGGGGDDEGSSDGEGSEDAHSRSTAAATGNFLRQAAGKAAAGDDRVPEGRIAPLNMHMLKLPKLRLELQKHGLSTKGDRGELCWRYDRFKQLYEAELDSDAKRTVAKILRQVEKEEASRTKLGKGKKQKPPSKSAQLKLDAQRRAGFQRLAQNAGNASVGVADGTALTKRQKAELCFQSWRKVFSESVGRYYYFNTMTRIGQFEEPTMTTFDKEPVGGEGETEQATVAAVEEKEEEEVFASDGGRTDAAVVVVEEEEEEEENERATPKDNDFEDFQPARPSNRRAKRKRSTATPKGLSTSGKPPSPRVTRSAGASSQGTSGRRGKRSSAKKQKKAAAAFSTRSRSGSHRSAKKKKAEPAARKPRTEMKYAQCPICNKEGSVEWVTAHIEKCLAQGSRSPPITRAASSSQR